MTIHQLAPLAKKYGITRLHSMRKSEVIERLIHRVNATELPPDEAALKACKKGAKKRALESMSTELSEITAAQRAADERARLSGVVVSPVTTPPSEPSIFNKQFQMLSLAYTQDITHEDVQDESLDVVMVDPFWLHATWTIRRKSIERAKAAMGQLWYEAKPVLRVNSLRGGDAGTGGRYRHDRDILIHGRSNHWFVAVSEPPSTFLLEIGYLARQRFFCLVRSNVVSTPQLRSVLRYDKEVEVSWLNACNLRPSQKPEWSPGDHSLSRKWVSHSSPLFAVEDPDGGTQGTTDYPFRISSEFVVYGSTSPDSQVTLDEEWVAVQPDGTFMVRMDTPENGKLMFSIDSTNRKTAQNIIVTLDMSTQVTQPKKLGKPKKNPSLEEEE